MIFDTEGVFLREFNPWKNFEQNLDAGLRFDAENSSPLGSASVHIEKVDNDDEHGSLLYRISLTNVAVDENSPVTKDQLELADALPVIPNFR